MSSSGQDGVLLDTLHRSVLSLGRGFDVTSDTRLLYCKGAPGSTLVDIDELNTRDLIPGLSNVSIDIDIVEEASGRNTTPVLPFLQVLIDFVDDLIANYFPSNLDYWVNFSSIISLSESSAKEEHTNIDNFIIVLIINFNSHHN